MELQQCPELKQLIHQKLTIQSKLVITNIFFYVLKIRKKYWLLPIIIVLVLFGGLIVLTQGSAVAPFIYTIF